MKTRCRGNVILGTAVHGNIFCESEKESELIPLLQYAVESE